MNWISVEDRLPENEQYVIAYCSSWPINLVSLVRFEFRENGNSYFWNDSLDKKASIITHWMPFPELPPK